MNWWHNISLSFWTPILCLGLIALFFLIMLYPFERRSLFSKRAKRIWQDFSFWISLLVEDFFIISITFVSFCVWGVFIYFRKIPIKLEYIILSLIPVIAFPTFIGLIRRFAKYGEIFEKVDIKTMWLAEKLIDFIRNSKASSDEKCVVVKHFYDKYSEDFGGVIIGAEEKEYMEQLRILIPLTKKNFYATLRGGKEPKYDINWFFEQFGRYGLSPEEKLSYLKTVNEASHVKGDRVRLMLFKYGELKGFCDDKRRQQFLNFNSNIKLYLAEPEEVKNYLQNKKVDGITLSEEETSFIFEDYAIFDKQIAVKHNGQNSLYLGMEKQISKMLLPFKLLKEKPDLFRKLEIEGIYKWNNNYKDWNTLEYDWDKWKKLYCQEQYLKEKSAVYIDKV